MDQYYTNSKLAKELYTEFIDLVPYKHRKLLVEPSAGTGAFFRELEGEKLGFDINPKYPGIFRKDFLRIDISDYTFIKEISVLGNPPFGHAGNVAIKFFNHSAKFAQYIGFILPKTFKKISIENRLNLSFFKIYERDCPKNSFIFEGSPYDVPTIFQIWEKNQNGACRDIVSLEKNQNLVEFICKRKAIEYGENQVLAIRRVGSKAGQVLKGLDHNENSTYFIRPLAKDAKAILENLDRSMVDYTVAAKSISKLEIMLQLGKVKTSENAEI